MRAASRVVGLPPVRGWARALGSGQDVVCRVEIGVLLMPARHAPKVRLALAALRCDMPARPAGLARWSSDEAVGFTDFSGELGVFGPFAAWRSEPHRPALLMDHAIEPRLHPRAVGHKRAGVLGVRFGAGAPDHVLDHEVLDGD